MNPIVSQMMSERHFDSEAELRDFIVTVADEYRAEANEHTTYETTTARYSNTQFLSVEHHHSC
jgi:hypothetical protein